MYEPLRRRALLLLKVPAEPHPPAGEPASLRVFRAGRNYFRLRLAGWAITQALALAGIVFWTTMLLEIERIARAERDAAGAAAAPGEEARQPDTTSKNAARPDNWAGHFAEKISSAASAAGGAEHIRGKITAGWAGYKQMLVEIAAVLPPWAFPLVWLAKVAGIGLYLLQIPVTYAVRRLDYEMRWYMVTDRSLRIRYGVWKVTESTMSFANVQQVTVTQGPLQRLLGLADVKVQSAGGGGRTEEQHARGEDMHTGLFHSVTNAAEIRDLILERLRRFRETGLGDPDESAAPATMPDETAASEARAAAQELLAEARALRRAVS